MVGLSVKKVLLALFACMLCGSVSVFADMEKFSDKDFHIEYVVPDTMRPQLSYIKIDIMYAHCQGTDDMRSSGFRYEDGSDEYRGCYLYLSDNDKMKDLCFFWFSTYGKAASDFQYDNKLRADAGQLEKYGWRLGEVSYDMLQPPLNKSHDCKESHYCYVHLRLYPPLEMMNKKINLKMNGGKNGTGWYKWTYWCEAGYSNKSGTTSIDYSLNFPYNVGKLSVSDMSVDKSDNLLVSYNLDATKCNALKYMAGCYLWNKDTISTSASGFMTNYLVENPLKETKMRAGIVRKYTTTPDIAEVHLYMPEEYNSDEKTEAEASYYGFPYAELTEGTYTMETKKVKLRWKVVGTDILNAQYVKNGHWYVKRTDRSSGLTETKSLPLDLSTREWVDNDVAYNNASGYTYTVVYRQEEWGDKFDTELTVDASKWTVESTNTGCNLTVKTTGESDRVNITSTWKASKVDGFYTLKIWRGSTLIYNSEIAGNVGTYTYSDISGQKVTLYQRVSNTYRVQLYHDDQLFDEASVIGNITGGTEITGLTASRGDYRDHVHLTWSAKRSQDDKVSDTYIIERRKLGTQGDNNFIVVTDNMNSLASYITYDDNGTQAGEYYEYRVSVKGDEGTNINSISAVGFTTSTGSISGTVKLKDGSAQSGVTVNLEAKNSSSTDLPAILLRSLRLDGKDNQGDCNIKVDETNEEYRTWLNGNYTIQFWYRADRETATEQLLSLPGSKARLQVDKQPDGQVLRLLNNGSASDDLSLSISAISENTFPWVHVTLLKTNTTQPSTTLGNRDVMYKLKIAWLDAAQTLHEDSCKMTGSEEYTTNGSLDRDKWDILPSSTLNGIGDNSKKAIDDDVDTYLSTTDSYKQNISGPMNYPVEGFVINMKNVHEVNKISFFTSTNLKYGRPLRYKIYAFTELPFNINQFSSSTINSWLKDCTPVASGDWTWPTYETVNTASFTPVKAQYIIFTADDVERAPASVGSVTYTSLKCSDFNIFTTEVDNSPLIGNDPNEDIAAFNGEVDEMRMYSRAITDTEITNTRFSRLGGKEKNLYCYLPMDEGINGYTFDHSVTSGKIHSATLSSCVSTSTAVPDGFYAYSTKTDAQGFYAISNIELTGNIFKLKATRNKLDEHFGPTERYCRLTSDVPSLYDQNFVDSTSVKVSGRVRYRWGTYPVEGVKVKIDGVTVQKNNKDVVTDKNGEFNIDVPVGRHYIEVAMDKHGFLAGGRFPATDTYDFQHDTVGVAFTDSTLVLLRGRVSGGAQQAALPMGVGTKGGSMALIGKATLHLAPVSNLNYRLNENEKDTVFIRVDTDPLVKADTADCNSTECILPYKANPLTKGQVLIETDPASGEFRALLPPMTYQVTDASTASVSSDELTQSLSEFNMIPGKESILNIRYDTKPVFDILDASHMDEKGENDKLFGEDSLIFSKDKYIVIDRTDTDNPKYVIGHPVFISGKDYTLMLHASQHFLNADYKNDQKITTVPLSNQLLSFEYNQWGEGETDTVRLNEEGRGVYRFRAAYPDTNNTPLYLFQGTCELGGCTYDIAENPISGLFTGFLIYDGQETLVQGPPLLDFILRDPPGSKSYATLSKGSTMTNTVNCSGSYTHGDVSELHISAGIELKSDLFDFAAKYNYANSWSNVHSTGSGSGLTSTVTTTETYQTGTDAYHVGAMGDVYIGHGSYISFGKGYYYGLSELKGTSSSSDFTLKSADGAKTAVFTGKEEMGCMVGSTNTTFALAQRDIIKTLIPEWELVAKNGTDEQTRNTAANNANVWREIVAYNEMKKIAATKPDTVLTYSAGPTQTFNYTSSGKQTKTVTTSGLRSAEWKLGAEGSFSFIAYFSIGGSGGKVDKTDYSYTDEESRQDVVTTSYTLADDDLMDYFDISVYNRASEPIFRVNGGASTKPWEGPDSTYYYLSGKTVLQTPTLKVEKCALRVLTPNLTDVPNGREATIQLALSNQSEVDMPMSFTLYPTDDTHESGLVMTIDGAPLTTAGLSFYIGAGRTITQTMKVKQTRLDVLDYDNIKLNLGGPNVQSFEYDNDQLYPAATFSVHFTKSSSPVTFSVRNTDEKKITNVNIASGTRVLLRAEDYQTDYIGFHKMRMQYKAAAETQWHTLGKEWTKDELEGTTRKDSIWDMKELADGTYQMRAVTLSTYGTEDVEFYSDTITLVKDMMTPQLLGEPEPQDGKLDCDDEIRYTFNENIFSGAVTKSNISVMMYEGSLSSDKTTDKSAQEVPFDFVVSDNVIVISPTIDQVLMQGNTLKVSITDIQDLNGNKSIDIPDKYIYVHQCPFAWTASSTYSVTFYNMSNVARQWTLEDIPSWLQLYDSQTFTHTETSGTIPAHGSKTLYKVIDPALPIGEYVDTMRIVDNHGLSESIVMSYTQVSDESYWIVQNDRAPYVSTISAQLVKQGPVASYDLVAAFVNDTTCVGTTYPTYINDAKGYQVMMNIYTNDDQKNSPITFKLYDPLTEIIYPDLQLKDDKGNLTSIKAPADNTANWGTPDAPYEMSITDVNDHVYDLNWGWNWLSFNIDIDADKRNAKLFLNDNDAVSQLEIIKSQTRSSKRNGETFNGDLQGADFEPGNMLMVKTNNRYQVTIRGKQTDAAAEPITLNARREKGPSYNWIGYTPIHVADINDAFSLIEPVEGDVVKSQTDFAYYTHLMWVGTLETIKPLKGYIYSSNDVQDRTLIFPEISNLQSNARHKIVSPKVSASRHVADNTPEAPWIWDPTQWSMNMTAIASVMLDMQPVSVGNVGIFDMEGECRSVKPITEDGHVYLTISGDDKCDLIMRLQTEDGLIYEQECPFSFTANDSKGSYNEPIVLYFDQQHVTGIDGIKADDVAGEIYNLAGQRIYRNTQKGVYIQNGQKIVK